MITGKLPPDKLTPDTPKTEAVWESIWQLVLQAEQLPPDQRRSFFAESGADPFTVRQALAILEGSNSLNTAATSHTYPGDRNPVGSFDPQLGARVGRYRLGTLLGTGGTSRVYAGFDEHLHRPVAVKLIESGRKSHRGMEPLSLREARAASALNHPNIITVLEVIEEQDVSAIVMEFVDGVTLRVANQSPLPMQQAIRYGLQLSEALAAAHERGLIHGDVKPDNAMVRKDGYVKLLDFGLTLNTALEEPSSSALSGTLRYLAPERWSGHSASSAADVFALGVTLYELVTGRFPWQATTTFDLFRALNENGSARKAVSQVSAPPKLKSLLEEMLHSHPASRPSAQQVAARLAEFRLPPQAVAARTRFLLIGILAALTLMVVSALFWKHVDSGSAAFLRMSVRPLASQPGIEDDPAVSPNGEWISCLFRDSPADPPQLQVHPVAGGPPIIIDTSGLTPGGRAAWSPDSTELAFAAENAVGDRAIYRVSRSGGALHKVTDCRRRNDFSCELDWSPDAKTFVITDRVNGASELYEFNLQTRSRRDLVSGESKYLEIPRYSPDGSAVAYTKEVSWDDIELYVIPSHGGGPHKIVQRAWIHQGFSWSTDGKNLIAISSRPGLNKETGQQLWQIPVDGSSPSPLGDIDVSRGNKPALGRHKNVFTWVRDLSTSSLWQISTQVPPITRKMLAHSAAVDIDADWSWDGRIVFRSDRSGASQLWISPNNGSGAWQATRSEGTFVGDPHWSPDGNSIAFMGRRDGNSDIFVMTCRNGSIFCDEPRQLTHDPAADANPTWSLNGHWIYFSSSRTGSYEVWRVPFAGGLPERVTWTGGYMARESLDGKWLYYSKLWPTSFWKIPLPDGPFKASSPIPVIREATSKAGATWALSKGELFFYPSTEVPQIRFPAIRAFDLSSGRSRDIDVGPVRLNRGLSLSHDQRWLLHSEADRPSKLIMVGQ